MVDKNLENLQELWKKDCKIDNTKIVQESTRIPELHARYLKYLSDERIKLQSLKIFQKEKQLELENYYSGKYNEKPEKLKELGKPPLHRANTKQQIAQYVETDEDMQMINTKIIIQDEIVEFLLQCMHHINQRNFIINNIVKWKSLTEFGDM